MDNTSFAPGNNSINNSAPPPTPELVPPAKHFNNKKFIITFAILLLIGIGAYAGIWYWGNQQGEPVPLPSPLASITPDPTADWQTYSNTEYGFEVKYPRGWKVDDECIGEDYGVIVIGMKEKMVLCNSDAPIDGPIFLTMSSLVNSNKTQRIDSAERGLLNVSREQISINNVPATKISGITKDSELGGKGGLDEIDVIFNDSTTLYMFTYRSTESVDYKEKFQLILSSFQFINSNM